MTAIPLSIGAQMIANGEINAKGVFPPEGVDIEPELFFDKLAKRGIKVERKLDKGSK